MVPNLKYIHEREGEFKNYIYLNSKGLRDYEYPYEKNNSIYRIAIVGDSFTDATQVQFNETIPKIIENELRKNSSNYEVINFGFGGFGLIPEAVMIKEEVLKYSPNIIVLNYFVGNDLNKIEYGSFNQFSDKFWIDLDNESLIKQTYYLSTNTKILSFLTRNSMIYFFIKKFKNHRDKNAYGDSSLRLNQIYEINYSSNLDKNLNTTRFIFNYLKTNLARENIIFLVVIIPTKEQVDAELFNKILVYNNKTIEEVDEDKLQREIKNILNDLNIQYLDLLPELRKENINNTFYYPIDGHFNKLGYQKAAELTLNKLK